MSRTLLLSLVSLKAWGQEAIVMQDEHEGAPECDPQKKATEAIEKFEAKARRRAQRVTASRTGKVVPLKKVHLDPRSCDLYQRLIEVTLRAAREIGRAHV